MRGRSRALGDRFENEGSGRVAETYGRGPSRIPFEIKDPRGFQGARPSLLDFEDGIRKLNIPALIVVGDEDERCIESSLFLKSAIAASGLVMFPKTGHVVNLEEPDLFNAVTADFLGRVEAGRWPARDPRSLPPDPPTPIWNRKSA